MLIRRTAFKIILILLLVFTVFGFTRSRAVTNIIFMVPDGLALSNITAARIYAYGTGGKRLNLETLKQIGYQSTHSANSMVTDSAAAASAWACGEKFNNGEISLHGQTGISPKTILEMARELGKKTGLVATSSITHATPAAFGAHVKDRHCENEIARQYITRTGVDLILGGGKGFFQSSHIGADPCGTYGDFIALAKKRDYTIVDSREEIFGACKNAKKILGLFRTKSLTPAYRKIKEKKSKGEPGLSEMTRAALRFLESHPEGFFLLVEGSQVDWANHANNLEYQIKEVLEFDRAVKTVLDWVKREEIREKNTLIIIVSDHDSGGFAIKGPRGNILNRPGLYVKAGWIWGSHTGEDTMIWSQGPYSKHLGKAIDNTDIFHIMRAALNGREYQKSK
jgi:alkaline phosphatase